MRIFESHCLLVITELNETIYAQETKARVIVTATANDNVEAKNLALRSAIEQAFGSYISSNTEILNDQLIKDEIISISSGNIDSIHVISENKLGEGRTSVTLLAVVSVNKLVTFCESKGYKVEFKGGLFSANLKQQKLNEIAELNAIENICEVGKSIINKSFDYSLTMSEPQKGEGDVNEEKWNIIYNVSVKPNSNFVEFKNFVYENLSRIAMNEEEVTKYRTTNKRVFNLKWVDPLIENEQVRESDFYFRNIQSLALIQDLFWHAKFSLGFFEIASNIDTVDIFNVSVFPKRSEFTSNLTENQYLEGDEFLSRRACLPQIKGNFVDLIGYSMPNFGIGKIYDLRSEFHQKQTLSLDRLKKNVSSSQDRTDSLWYAEQINNVNTALKNFYKQKYIFVLQNDNSTGDFEDFWERGYYIDEDDYLKVYLMLDSNYKGQFEFSRAFSLSEIEKITNVEVFPAGKTLGL